MCRFVYYLYDYLAIFLNTLCSVDILFKLDWSLLHEAIHYFSINLVTVYVLFLAMITIMYFQYFNSMIQHTKNERY